MKRKGLIALVVLVVAACGAGIVLLNNGSKGTGGNTGDGAGGSQKKTASVGSQSGKLSFSGYNTMGDTLTVSGGPKGAEYEWVESYYTYSGVSASTPNKKETKKDLKVKGNSYKTGKEDEECFITVTVKGDKQGSKYGKATVYVSSIPVMYVDSKDYEYKSYRLDAMDRHEQDYHEVSMALSGNSKYTDDSTYYDGIAKLKVRGNSTVDRPKTPFRLKLDQKADLLGLGDGVASKHWVLLANDIDHSLLRNKLLYDFSGDIGTEFFFQSTNVALIYNGEYEGVYQLCEQRRIAEGRIDITDWAKISEDAAEAIAMDEVENKAEAWKNTGIFGELASYDASASEEDNKKKAVDALEDALYEAMCSDYAWIDEKKFTYKANGEELTYDLTDEKYKLGEFPATTGGYVVEMDFYSIGSNTQSLLTTAYKQPLYVSLPEIGDGVQNQAGAVKSFNETSLYAGAKDLSQSFEYAIHSKDFVFRNSDTKKKVSADGYFDQSKGWKSTTEEAEFTSETYDGKHYSEIFDMESLVNNFIFVEYAMNWDSMKNSFFFYKDVDGLAKIGPQWDFDWCWGNINMYGIDTNYPTDWHTTIEYFTNEQCYQSYQWNRLLVKDPYFLVRAYEKYKKIRPIIEDMIKEGGLLDQYEEYLTAAGEANDRRWSFTYTNDKYYGWGARSQEFTASIASIRNFLKRRVEWLDTQFASLDSLSNSLGYYGEAGDITQASVTKTDNMVEFEVEVSNQACTKVVFQVNGTTEVEATVSGGKASASVDASVLTTDGSLNVVTAYEKGDAGYIENSEIQPSNNYEPIAKSSYAVFTSEGQVVEKTGENE